MSNEAVIHEVNTILAEEFEVDIHLLTPDAAVKEVLELDSLDYVDLVVLIESRFGFKVKQEDFIGIRTFADFYHYVYTRVHQPVTT